MNRDYSAGQIHPDVYQRGMDHQQKVVDHGEGIIRQEDRVQASYRRTETFQETVSLPTGNDDACYPILTSHCIKHIEFTINYSYLPNCP